MEPALEKLLGLIEVEHVHLADDRDEFIKNGVMGTPTLVLLEDDVEVDRTFNPKTLRNIVDIFKL